MRTDSNSDKGEGGAVAGNGFKFIQRAAGVAEGAAGDHGYGDAAGRSDGRDEETGFVAYAAGGVLVDGGFAEARRGEFFAGVAHGKGEGADFVEREAANPCGHEPGGELFEGDGSGGGAGNEEGDLVGVERSSHRVFCG